MSLPRPVHAGQTVMLTRRCTQRQFLLRPSRNVNEIVLYCLAVAAERYGIEIHGFCALSNHVHAIVTDRRGERPEFCRWFHEFTAKCLNALYGRWENLWASEPTSVVDLLDEWAQVDKLVYTETNPVKSALVARAEHWPGARCGPRDLGRTIVIQRPKSFFRAEGVLPECAMLRITKLPALAHLSDEQYVAELSAAIEVKEAEHQAELRAAGRRVLGRRAVLEQSPFDRPDSREPRRKLSPRVASRDKKTRVDAIERLKAFVGDYRRAWEEYRRGRRSAAFPRGTYWMAVYLGVCCAAAG